MDFGRFFKPFLSYLHDFLIQNSWFEIIENVWMVHKIICELDVIFSQWIRIQRFEWAK